MIFSTLACLPKPGKERFPVCDRSAKIYFFILRTKQMRIFFARAENYAGVMTCKEVEQKEFPFHLAKP